MIARDASDVAGRVREAGGAELLERLVHLDRTRAEGAESRRADDPLPAPERGASIDADVIMAGGGLSLLVAAALASRGVRVVVIERARAGATHREWNASEPELRALVRGGLFSEDEVASLIIAEYTRGICRFHGGATHAVRGVLDRAVDAAALLGRVREIASARGARFLDDARVCGVGCGEDAVRVRAEGRHGASYELTARILIDARGAASPYASADLVCPTVGGVLRGLAEGDGEDEVDPRTGEILITNEPLDGARQHLWEAFPGRDGETTVYAFYYARARGGEAGSLLDLYGRFFRTLGGYKRGEATLVRPTFGFIPGWSRLGAPARPPGARIVLVGDAAARHSPLTFCGFGAMLRSFDAAAAEIAAAVAEDRAPRTERGALAHDTPVHALTGGLARLMASSGMTGNALNELLDAAFGTLAAMGDDAYGALLRDEMDARGFVSFLRRTAAVHPRVYREVLRGLGAGTLGRWGLRVAREVAFAR